MIGRKWRAMRRKRREFCGGEQGKELAGLAGISWVLYHLVSFCQEEVWSVWTLRRLHTARFLIVSLKMEARAWRTPSADCTEETRGFNFRSACDTILQRFQPLRSAAIGPPKIGERNKRCLKEEIAAHVNDCKIAIRWRGDLDRFSRAEFIGPLMTITTLLASHFRSIQSTCHLVCEKLSVVMLALEIVRIGR